jgi:hypothetical protein
MKQTPVEWLVAELRKYGSPVPRQDEEQAKEMEKQQDNKMYSEEDLREAIRYGFDKGFCSNSSNKTKNLELSEQEWFEKLKNK